jgi:hypothetical protein
MFKSSRFNTIVTDDTRARLLRAQDNTQPIARGEAHRGAVVAIQAALSALNTTYLVGAEIDGYYGARTYQAVEAFQRDYGLIADGMVGHQVLDQLDAMFSGEIMRAPHAVSVHVGVDRVDPAHYGAPMTLPSCENDAKAMFNLAEALGYDALVLANEQATTANFTAFMRSAASNLFSGDCLLATFSGHGGQMPNTSSDDEPDLLDETMCFYDRMLVDDEFYALLAELRAGVRVHIALDSCHSGTAVKALVVSPDEDPEPQRVRYVEDVSKSLVAVGTIAADDEFAAAQIQIKTDSLDKALDGERPDLVDKEKPDPALDKEIAELFGDLYTRSSFGKVKFLDGTQVYDRNPVLYDTVKDIVGSRENAELSCTVTSLSACSDAQTTPAGNPLSLFTFNLTQTWGTGGFRGSYSQFHRAMKDRSRPDATPQLNFYGSGGSEARLGERPFMF